jgi:hypothetical protein
MPLHREKKKKSVCRRASAATAVTPVVGQSIWQHGGWFISGFASFTGILSGGWIALEPADGIRRQF